MLPGENRWISFTVDYVSSMSAGTNLPVSFNEMYKSQALNGFTISPRIASKKEFFIENIRLNAEILHRLHHSFEIPEAGERSKKLAEILKLNKVDEGNYFELVGKELDFFKEVTIKLIDINKGGDPFKIKIAFNKLSSKSEVNKKNEIVTAHSAYLHKMDAFITMLNKQDGDEADILQNLRWQVSLFSGKKKLTKLSSSARLIKISQKFIVNYGARKVSNKDYSKYMDEIYPLLKEVASALGNSVDLDKELSNIKRAAGSPQKLQKAHWEYLLKLHAF